MKHDKFHLFMTDCVEAVYTSEDAHPDVIDDITPTYIKVRNEGICTYVPWHQVTSLMTWRDEE